jgi:hypothetical protein
MALATLGGKTVIEARVVRGLSGSWVIEATVDSKTALAGRVVFTTPGLTLSGTVDATLSGVFQETAQVRVLAGAGRLSEEIGAKSYRGVTLRTVLLDILTAKGELLSATSDASLLSTSLSAWVRFRGSADAEIAKLLETVGASWRMLDDGTVWIGRETWPTLAGIHQVIEDHPEDGRSVVASEKPFLRPGATFNSRQVREVVDTFSADKVRSEYVWTPSFPEVVRGIARSAIGPASEARTFYPARVIGQPTGTGGSLELKPDSDHLPGLVGVPIRGLPGIEVGVNPGARCMVGFEGADRRKPFAALFEDDGIAEIRLAGGTSPVARVGDHVEAWFTITAPSGGGPCKVVPLDAVTGPLTPLAVKLTLPLVEGAAKVKA